MKYIKKFDQKDLNCKLMHCSRNKSTLNQMRELLSNGADPNYLEYTGLTALMEACRFFYFSGVKLLLENGADVNKKNVIDMTAFYTLSINSGGYNYIKHQNSINKIADLLIGYGADISIMPQISKHWDQVSNIKFVEYIKEKHPNEFNNYIMKKDAEKYNL